MRTIVRTGPEQKRRNMRGPCQPRGPTYPGVVVALDLFGLLLLQEARHCRALRIADHDTATCGER